MFRTSVPRFSSGFTLVELAIVILIIGLLLGGLLTPLSAQIELRRLSETQKTLQEIRDALVGFAVTNGHLPCPDYDTDPAAAGYGVEDSSCNAPTVEGFLPWKTLGVADVDAWGARRSAAASPRLGDWRYRVDRNYVTTTSFRTSAFLTSAAAFQDNLQVNDRAGNQLTTDNERAIAVVYSAGKDATPNLENGIFNSTYASDVLDNLDPTSSTHYDDVLIWLSRPFIINRMVAAGRLP
ncbi:MAG: prepilin-type N-terminal cleavage/methylation domain-containing protein [Burkholderiales bacterium]|nr:prepilin-type N-terminal cleavage/methylation domain-containing protein [Burkholderiales bacterium]